MAGKEKGDCRKTAIPPFSCLGAGSADRADRRLGRVAIGVDEFEHPMANAVAPAFPGKDALMTGIGIEGIGYLVVGQAGSQSQRRAALDRD